MEAERVAQGRHRMRITQQAYENGIRAERKRWQAILDRFDGLDADSDELLDEIRAAALEGLPATDADTATTDDARTP